MAVYIFVETASPTGSRDFHQFWYAGHFVREGRDPYAAFFAGERPELPVRYLDGVTVNQYPVAQGDLARAPTNTPIMVLLLTPFSYFSWDTAKWMILGVNVILMAATGWLVLRRIPFGNVKLAAVDELLLFLIYFDLSATRIAIENGQTTLSVFLFMLLAILYANRSWQIAGTALGLALSKYSLSLPVFLFFLYKKKFKLVLLAILVQILGVMILSALTRTSPIAIMLENIRLFFEIFNQAGVFLNLASQFEELTANQLLRNIPSLLITLFVFVLFLRWISRRKSAVTSSDDVMDFHLLTILFVWTMLVGYHRLYDTLILFFFVVLVFKGLAYPNLWRLSHRQKNMLLAFMAAIPPIWMVPERVVDWVFPAYYGAVSNGVASVFFTVMLIISLFLLGKYLQNKKVKPLFDEASAQERSSSHRAVEENVAEPT